MRGGWSGFAFFCGFQVRVVDGGIGCVVPGGGVGHELNEAGEPDGGGLGFEFGEVFLELRRGEAFGEACYVGEVVVEGQADDGAGFQSHEFAEGFKGAVELRGDAESDGFPTGGAGSMRPQRGVLCALVSVFTGESLEDGGFVSRVFGEQGVDAVAVCFRFCPGLLLAAVFEVGKVAYKLLFAPGYAEPPAVECAKFLGASSYVLRRHTFRE